MMHGFGRLMEFAKTYGLLLGFPLAVALVIWLLDKAGIALPQWLLGLLGCIVIAAFAFGLFYPLQRILDKWRPFGPGVVSYNTLTAVLLLCVLASVAASWWLFGRGAAASVLTIKTELRLQFYGDTRTASELYAENINSWYTLWSPHAKATFTDASGKVLSETLYPKSWNIFVMFEKPTRYKQVIVSFSGPNFPQHEVKTATDRFVIINVVSDIPAGDLDIYCRP